MAGLYERDPVSVAFDAAARKLLDKAYAAPGEWAVVWLPDPSIRQRTRWAGTVRGDLTGPDPLPAGGGIDAKSRWARGFIRALYYQHRNYSGTGPGSWRAERRRSPRGAPLRVEVGRHVAASPQFDPQHPEHGGFPPRRRVRAQLAKGGKKQDAAVVRLAAKDRIWVGDKELGGRWAGGARYQDWG